MPKEANHHTNLSFDSSDIYERKPLCYNVTSLIFNEDNERGTVISLDGKWGTGKTQTVKMWFNELNNNAFGEFEDEFFPVYFDSWHYDD